MTTRLPAVVAPPEAPTRVHDDVEDVRARARAAPSRLGLSVPDAAAVSAFVTTGGETLVEHARGLADALSSADADGARLRTVSRSIGIVRSQLNAVDAALGASLGRGDVGAMRELRKVSESLSRRLCALLDQHRRELRRDEGRAVLLVGAAQNVNVGGR